MAFLLARIERPPGLEAPLDRQGAIDVFDIDLARRQLFPDLVLVADGPQGEQRGGGLVLTVEVQSRTNGQKRWRIPHYQAALAEEHERETWVVVVSFNKAVSRQLAAWKETGPPRFEVIVLDAGRVPVGYDMAQALARPSAAVLGATLHACQGDIDAARWGLEVVSRLPAKRRMRDATTILAAVDESMRLTLIQEFPFAPDDDRLMEIERRSGTYHLGHEEGVEEGRRRVLKTMVLALLEVRGIALSEVERARVDEETRVETLERWAERARTATQAGELFERSLAS
ncbi:hypothetical protein PPSIR1_23634 [Plesiocystis pacifica SIR-1]|uniref:Uncharacterized protein n=1 Tax=Plesiocystis pacifica SIR-1 TaxID=391625 RepID=A6G7W9_9BACT|nr:hypothetical protein [Plesiocystis pacifica]EDM78062.1 hypothetical protein PPSIR1_23634 [Plesiocystis pacifica SIR-1]